MIEKQKIHTQFKTSKKIEKLVNQISDLCSETADENINNYINCQYYLSIDQPIDDTINVIFKAIKLSEDHNLPVFIGNICATYSYGEEKYIFVDTEANIIAKLKASILKLEKLIDNEQKSEDKLEKDYAIKQIAKIEKDLTYWAKIAYPIKKVK